MFFVEILRVEFRLRKFVKLQSCFLFETKIRLSKTSVANRIAVLKIFEAPKLACPKEYSFTRFLQKYKYNKIVILKMFKSTKLHNDKEYTKNHCHQKNFHNSRDIILSSVSLSSLGRLIKQLNFEEGLLSEAYPKQKDLVRSHGQFIQLFKLRYCARGSFPSTRAFENEKKKKWETKHCRRRKFHPHRKSRFSPGWFPCASLCG